MDFYPEAKKPLKFLKTLVNTLSNYDDKVAFVWVGKYVALARSSEFIRTCHNMNTTVQTTGGDASYLHVKSEIPNKTLANHKGPSAELSPQ